MAPAFAAAAAPAQPQFGGGQPAFGGGPGPMMSAAGGEIRGDFSGTGGELLGQLFVGYLLTLITFGIYGPWFMCKFANFIAERVTFGPTAKGTVRFRFEGQGGELFVTFLVGYLLTMVTFGIYSPWFICKLNKWFASNTKITKNGQQVGDMDFVGQGGDLLVTFIVGYLLTLVTFGIYMAWFQVKLMSFNAESTKITVEGQRMGMRFTGEGGELFVIMLVGYLLSLITLGIYMFWMMAKLLKWQLSNTVVFPEGGGGQMSMGAPMGGQAFGAPPPQGQMYGQPPQGQLAPPQGGYGAPPQGGYGGPPQGGYGGPPQGGYGGPPQGGGYA